MPATACLEHLADLLDEGSFSRLAAGRPSAEIVGLGTIDGRPVGVFVLDLSALEESDGELAADAVVRVIDLALAGGFPLIGVYVGAEPGPPAEHARWGVVLRRITLASGVVPQISVVLGSLTGPLALAPALTDLVVMVEGCSHLMLTSPDQTAAVTGERVTPDALGGGRTHAAIAGTAHLLAADPQEALAWVGDLLAYLPQNNLDEPPLGPATEGVDGSLDPNPNLPQDLRAVVEAVVDDGDFLELQPLHASSIVCGFARIDRRPVGVVANQPLVLGGCLDVAACEKAARFIRTCDAFNLPIVTLVDTPGFRPGVEQEHGGLARRAAALAHAYAAATVPLVTVITGRASGAAGEVMGSQQLGADLTLAWSTASCSSSVCSSHGQPVDRVIAPHETRAEVAMALRLLHTKRVASPPKKHGNLPL
ncbi:acyl-CoA carboxylase subunit beta [Aestuariimicrobium soli]|uniref:acyl-CoA carboxylase subunit beta n=1 Tax=Aestuariimicrobium soli TaxID=2035834 RepID=UPI003EBF5869